MSEDTFGGKMKELYKKLCQDEWNAYTVGILVAFFSVLILAWMRPWGAVGAIRNWGDWTLYMMSIPGYEDAPRGVLTNSGSISRGGIKLYLHTLKLSGEPSINSLPY